MRGYPITNDNLNQKLESLQKRIVALAQPHSVATDEKFGDIIVNVYTTDPLNVWEPTITESPVTMYGDFLYLTFDNGYADANHEYEVRYYQSLPTPVVPGSYVSLFTGTLPFTSIASSVFVQSIDLEPFRSQIEGTFGYVQLWQRRIGASSLTFATGKISIGGLRP